LAQLRVYRAYVDAANPDCTGRATLAPALQAAMHSCLPTDRVFLEPIARLLSGAVVARRRDRQGAGVSRFQHVSAPLACQAGEGTAFYRYGRLLPRLDVGFDATRFCDDTETFHRESLARLKQFPRAMLATATHDHKRGEDVRARLAVLS